MGLGEVLEAIAGLDAVEPWRCPDAELQARVPELSAAIHRLEATRVSLVAEADQRCIPASLGYTCATAWLAWTSSLSFAAAGRIAKLARALPKYPEVAAAYSEGVINAESALLIVAFLQKPPRTMPEDAVASAQQYLLEAAKIGDTRELRVHVARLWNLFEDETLPASEDLDRNELFASVMLNGRMAIKGDVDAETGDMLLAALSPLAKPRPTTEAGGSDRRSPGQRRADALTELLRRYHDSGVGPDDGGDRPHLHVHIKASDLLARGAHVAGCANSDSTAAAEPAPADTTTTAKATTAKTMADTTTSDTTTDDAASVQPDRDAYRALFDGAGVGWMPWMGPLTVQSTRRLACDCVLSPIVMDENMSPVNLGRTARLVPKKLRKAVVARDHGCAFPGCGRPASWCDAHHIKHWIDGGATDLDNLVLLCRFHHRLIHHSEWEVVMGVDRHPWFVPPAKIDPLRSPVPAHGRASPAAA